MVGRDWVLARGTRTGWNVQAKVARLAVIGAVAALALAGCNDDAPQPSSLDTPEPSSTAKPTTPTPAATTTGSPSDSPTASDSPATKKGRVRIIGSSKPTGPEGEAVKAFMRRFVKVDNHATETGDYEVRDTMVTDGCQVCAASKRYTTKLYDGGGKIDGSLFTDSTINITGTAQGKYFVKLDTVVSAYKSYNGAGTVVDQGPDEHQIYSYVVKKNPSGDWQIVGGGVQ